MLLKIFLYFLYNEIKYIYSCCILYIKGQLSPSGKRVNPKPKGLGFKSSQQQIKVRHCSITVARWRHCSGVWLSLTRVDHAIYRRKIGDLSQNHLYIARNLRFLARIPEISPDRYFSMKYRVETHRYTIFSSMHVTWVKKVA